MKQNQKKKTPVFENLLKNTSTIELSVKTANCLKNAGVKTIWELVTKTEDELLKIKNFSRRSVYEIKEMLSEMGLSLGMKLESEQFETRDNAGQYELIAIGLFGDKLHLLELKIDDEGYKYTYLNELNTYGGFHLVDTNFLVLRDAVEELEELINSDSTREEDLQDFFERYPDFILNDNYKRAHPKIVLENRESQKLIPDFILEPYDEKRLCDVLELKHPFSKVYIMKKNRPRFSAAVTDAIAQLREYREFFEDEENRQIVLDKHGLHAFRPRLFVIIGRRGQIAPITRRRIEGDFSNFEIFTYDDIIIRMKEKLKKLI